MMKGSDGNSSKTLETPANPTVGMTVNQGRLLALERSTQELRDSMMQMMKNWNVNPPLRRRIERDLGDEFDDPGLEYEPEEANRPRRQQRSLDNIKMKILPFRGTSSLKEYLEWVQGWRKSLNVKTTLRLVR